MKLAPEEALAAARATPPTCSAAPTGSGASRPGYDADVVLLDAPDWRYVAYHLAGDIVHTVVQDGAVAWSRTAY